MDKLLVGVIVKPQGIRGEVKVKLFTDDFTSVSGLNEIYVDDVLYPALKMRRDKDVFMLFKGIADRNAAETLRGKELFAEKSKVRKPKNRYFICDVIGCNVVFEDGTVFGRVVDILSARTDIYYVDTADGRALFPLIPEINPVFDIENKKITVDKQAFEKEVHYED